MGLIQPWKGRDYEQGVLGKRVLLLGESNYDQRLSPENDYSNIVRENVQDCVFAGSVSFFTKAAKIILKASDAAHSSREQIRDLWQHIAFNNYVPKVFSDSRMRPSDDDWPAGQMALADQLTELKPQVLVVMGLALGSHMDWLWSFSPQLAVARIAHPSSFGFRYEKWVPVVREALLSGNRGVGRIAQAPASYSQSTVARTRSTSTP